MYLHIRMCIQIHVVVQRNPGYQSSNPDVLDENRRDSNYSTWNLLLGHQSLNEKGLKGHSIDCLEWRNGKKTRKDRIGDLKRHFLRNLD